MQITILAIANFTSSSGPIDAGETVAIIDTDRPLSITRDLLGLVRSGEDFVLDPDAQKVEVGELMSLLCRPDLVYCESDDPEFEKDRDPEAVEALIAEQEETKPAPKRRRKKAPAKSAE